MLPASDPGALRAFLEHPSRPAGTLSYHELQGFLFTVVSAPELVPPSDWLPVIFGEQEIDYASPAEAKGILGQIITLYNAIVSYETVRQWCGKFGPDYARKLKRRQGRLGDTWFLDEVFVTINGERQYLWRPVDQDGDLIDILVQPRRDGRAMPSDRPVRTPIEFLDIPRVRRLTSW